MTTKKAIMMTGVLCFFMLIGLKQSNAQNVQIGINLPYSGNYNEWNLTFTNESTYEVYYFTTGDANFSSQILGSLPAGTYTIEFADAGGYFPWEGFDFGVCGNNYYSFKTRNDNFTWYHAIIDASTSIQIDEGY